jgi:hypothetical protein
MLAGDNATDHDTREFLQTRDFGRVRIGGFKTMSESLIGVRVETD